MVIAAMLFRTQERDYCSKQLRSDKVKSKNLSTIGLVD
jgi:hypothetical protein